ncbi:MAG: glycoside hydrolase family 130 protein [Balneolales bacterium]|nr:glycoside hydrolase family 130 protein [Balneolales bacterium]
MKNRFIKRSRTKIVRNASRVITRTHVQSKKRIPGIISRVLDLSEEKAIALLKSVYANFSDRHKDIVSVFDANFNKFSAYIQEGQQVSSIKKQLIGAYFTMEYSIESAALFNPSIVPHPNQEGIAAGDLRFILSLRATGEGHISSIVFRSGVLHKDGFILLSPVSEFVETPTIRHDQSYVCLLFQRKLEQLKAWNETSMRVFQNLPESFTFSQLKKSIEAVKSDKDILHDKSCINNILWLADSNYFIKFDSKNDISERVIFPVSENESKGIEDARFVQFFYENGETVYYATYTAYNGVSILPQLLSTKDFIFFDIITLNGKAVHNKGMALFPRKIKGKYVMLSRKDGVNNFIMYSDHMHFWDEAEIIQEPKMPWEFIQIGNCGSPIETNEGWLVITHGVGPMRQYAISAILLDLENPSKVIARLEEPLLTPNEEEREGYVPNVVYSCGSLIHNNKLILPYAMSDITSRIATVDVAELIARMKRV